MASWEEQAQCKGMSPNLFSVAHLGDDEVASIGDLDSDKYNKLKRYNRKKMARAVEYCRGCPVWLECLDSAEPDDRLFTVRGGFEPEGFEPLAPKKPKKNQSTGKREETERRKREEKMSKPCPKGHVDWVIAPKSGRVNGAVECVTCRREKQKVYRDTVGR